MHPVTILLVLLIAALMIVLMTLAGVLSFNFSDLPVAGG